MSKLILITGDDADSLLRAAAAPFCGARPQSSSLPLLAVRQGGLRDAVHEIAAGSGAPGWFGRPIVVFAELAELFGGDRAPLDAFEREALISRILTEQHLHTLGAPRARRSIVAALDRLIGDLVSEDVDADALNAHLSALHADEWSGNRNADVVTIYRAYRAAVAALEPIAGVARSDGRDGLLLAACTVAESGSGMLAGLRRPFENGAAPRSIDIYGLADLRRGWRRFLDALSESGAVDELRLYALDEPVGAAPSEVRRWAMERGAVVRRVSSARTFAPALAALRGSVLTDVVVDIAQSADVTVTAAPDMTRELENVARNVKRLLVEGDDVGRAVEPRDIAIVSRQARPYLTRAAEVFERYGIPTYARLRHTLSDVPAIAAAVRVFRAAADGWTRRGLRELSDSPYFAVRFDVGLLAEAAGQSRPQGIASWKTSLDTLQAQRDDDDDGIDAELIARRQARIDEARATFDTFAEQAVPLEGRKSRAEWIDLTIRMLGGIEGGSQGFLDYADSVQRPLAPTAPRILRDAARVDAAAVRAVVDLLVRWRAAVAFGPMVKKPSDAGEWVAEFEHVLGDEEISVRCGERGGVQLLEASASEGQSWGHVFVVGMSTGSFPAEPGRDLLFNDAERQQLFEAGLPIEPASVWHARETALFRGLVNAPSASLRLSYAYADASGSVELRSAYLDDVVSRVNAPEARWVTTIPGSRVAPAEGEGVWCDDEALRVAALATRDSATDQLARQMLGAVSANSASGAMIEHLLHAAHVERTRSGARATAVEGTARTELAHEWNGRIDDPALLGHLAKHFGDRTWSATQLEKYGRCGFTFFGKYVLRANELEEIDEDEVSARDAGSIMHAVLAATYERLSAHDPASPLSAANSEFARDVVEEEVAKAFTSLGVKGPEGIHAARVRETTILLREYVDWEIRANDKDKGKVRPLHMELGFGMDEGDRPAVSLEHGGRQLRLRGRIDRVDELIHDAAAGFRAIVDHKLGGSALAPVGVLQAGGANVQLALYLAALEQLLPGTSAWGGAYQIIKDPSRTAKLNLASIGSKNQLRRGELDTEKKSLEKVRDVARLALSLVDGVLAGRFAARVPDGAKCLAYCSFRTACREEQFKE